jgi:hypothetical protein
MHFPMNALSEVRNPVLCCGFCSTPVLVLPSDVKGEDIIFETIMKSEPIPPQEKPYPEQKTQCATCGKWWTQRSFTLIEGGQHLGKTRTGHQSGAQPVIARP